jgi:GDPmannose 4,6-dehydratase
VEQKKALICGVSGQDGTYLAAFLLQKGYAVFGTSRDPSSALRNLSKLGIEQAVRLKPLDILRAEDVAATLRDIGPHELYNFSGQSSPGASFDLANETMRSIAIGTLNMLQGMLCVETDIRFLNAGSSECFADCGRAPIDEGTPFKPRNPYGIAKVTAAHLTAVYRQAFRLHANTAYLFNHESPLRHERFVTQKVVAAACRIANGSKERLKLGNLEVERDWGWAPDYVDAMWRMLQQEEADDFVIGTGIAIKLSEFVRLAFESVGLNWQNHVDIDQALFRASDVPVIKANPSKALRLLGWRPTRSIQEVVRSMVESSRVGSLEI